MTIMVMAALVQMKMQPNSQSAVNVATPWQKKSLLFCSMGFLLAMGIALFSSETIPQRAFKLTDLNSLTSLQLQNLLEQEHEGLLASPLDGQRLNNLALLERRLGNGGLANRFYAQAALLSVRNTSAQLELVDDILKTNNYVTALKVLDGQLRVRPDLQTAIFPKIIALAGRETGLAALVDMLATNLPWRLKFVRYLAQESEQTKIIYDVIAQMKFKKISITEIEKQIIIKALVDHHQIEKANFVWLDLLSASEIKKVHLLYDGEFSEKPQNMFFDWTLHAVPNVSLAVGPRGDAPDNFALGIDFLDAKPTEILVSQILMLPTGKFNLTGEVDGSRLHGDSDIEWQLRCTEKTAPLAMTSGVLVQRQWAEFEITFDVPEKDCGYQKLVLRSRSSTVSDLNGQVYFDNFNLVAVD
jgi:hypothetical protein